MVSPRAKNPLRLVRLLQRVVATAGPAVKQKAPLGGLPNLTLPSQPARQPVAFLTCIAASAPLAHAKAEMLFGGAIEFNRVAQGELAGVAA